MVTKNGFSKSWSLDGNRNWLWRPKVGDWKLAIDCGNQKNSVAQNSDKKVKNLIINLVAIEFVFGPQSYGNCIFFQLQNISGVTQVLLIFFIGKF
jgi:hypothetical protein